jgi:hypothetical protein
MSLFLRSGSKIRINNDLSNTRQEEKIFFDAIDALACRHTGTYNCLQAVKSK